MTLPYLARSRPRATIAAALSATYVLAPQFPSRSSLTLLVVATATSFAIWRPSRDDKDGAPGARLITPALLAAVLLAVLAAAVTDFGQARDAVESAVLSNRVAAVVIGLTACAFLGGSTVAWILAPFTKALGDPPDPENLPSLANAGRYIGWFERAILFAFVLGGQPQAAALALAAKSFARFPALREHHEGFAEYFLIGSLASLAIAVALALGTRAALGENLLP
jgi:hypothetical protein